MNACAGRRCPYWLQTRLLGLAAAAVLASTCVEAVQEHHYDVLQIGTQTYKNVTVTTKAKNYIFILHSTGMTNVRIAELPPSIRAELGYDTQKSGSSSARSWASATLAKLDLPSLGTLARKSPGSKLPALPPINRTVLLIFLGVTLAVYLFFCNCCRLICKKTGNEPGALIWFPILQMVPLLRAADMSGGWLLAWFVPVLNVVAQIFWSVKIVEARGKSGWVALLLLVPVTSLFAFLYLAFSNGAPPKKEEPRVELMTLETA